MNISGSVLLQAVANFREDYRAMLLSFNELEVLDALASLLHTEYHETVDVNSDESFIETVLEVCFTELLARGAIAAVRPFSVLGQKQLSALPRISRVSAAEVQAAAPPDPMGEVVADFAGRISTSEFKRKCQSDPAYFELYEQAIENGRIV